MLQFLMNVAANTFIIPLLNGECFQGRKEGNVLFNDALSTFFINGYMASDLWLRTILIVRKETRCRHIGYSFRLTERVLLYALSHRQDSTYHGLCSTDLVCIYLTDLLK